MRDLSVTPAREFPMSSEPIAELESLMHPDATLDGPSTSWGSDALWEALSLQSVWLGAGNGAWATRA